MFAFASLARLVCFAGFAALASGQQLWIVDDDGPGDFVDVQDAIGAASDGDTILVRAGSYSALEIDGKSLTIQGIGQPTVSGIGLFAPPTPSITIRNIAANQEVHMSGIKTQPLLVFELENILIGQCVGSVTFEHCDFSISGGESVVLTDCESATFVDCQLFASPTYPSTAGSMFLAHVPYDGVIAVNSSLFLYNCEVRGSEGVDGHNQLFTNYPPGPAGAGVSLRGSTLLASGCTFVGGNAGGDPANFCETAHDGQPALEVGPSFAVAASTAELIDCVLVGGTGGVGGCGAPDAMDAPNDLVSPGSTLVVHAGLARSLGIGTPLSFGSQIRIHTEGAPGDEALLFFAPLASTGIKIPGLPLALHMGLPLNSIGLGTIPANGILDITFPAPPFVGHQMFFAQLVCIDGTGAIFASGPNSALFIQ